MAWDNGTVLVAYSLDLPAEAAAAGAPRPTHSIVEVARSFDLASWEHVQVPEVPQGDVVAMGVRSAISPALAVDPGKAVLIVVQGHQGTAYSLQSNDGGATWGAPMPLEWGTDADQAAFAGGRFFHRDGGFDILEEQLADRWNTTGAGVREHPCRDFALPLVGDGVPRVVCAMLWTRDGAGVTTLDTQELAIVRIENGTTWVEQSFGPPHCYTPEATALPDGSVLAMATCGEDVGKPILGFVSRAWLVRPEGSTKLEPPFGLLGPVDGTQGTRILGLQADSQGVAHVLSVTAINASQGMIEEQLAYFAWEPATGNVLRHTVLARASHVGNDPTGVAYLARAYATVPDQFILGRQPWDGDLAVHDETVVITWQDPTGVLFQRVALGPEAANVSNDATRSVGTGGSNT